MSMNISRRQFLLGMLGASAVEARAAPPYHTRFA